jgi:hypothetical protein
MTPEELAAVRASDYRSAINRAMGQGGMVSNERVHERLKYLIDEKGVPARYIAKRAGVTEVMVLAHYHRKGRTGGNYGKPLTECRWKFEQAILSAKFGPADQFLVDACGVQRRIGALVCKGYSYAFLAQQLGVGLAVFHRKLVTDRRGKVRATFHREIVALHEKLINEDPEEMGVSAHGRRYTAKVAAKHGYVPDHCWDSDTIDDPDAFPEWTGACGTVTGYNLHRNERIFVEEVPLKAGGTRVRVLCAPCCEARQKRKSEYEQRRIEGREKALAWLAEGKAVTWIALELGVSTRTVERYKKEQ